LEAFRVYPVPQEYVAVAGIVMGVNGTVGVGVVGIVGVGWTAGVVFVVLGEHVCAETLME
jgi:hypothetical protein